MNQDRGTAELAPVTATLAGQPSAAATATATATAAAAATAVSRGAARTVDASAARPRWSCSRR